MRPEKLPLLELVEAASHLPLKFSERHNNIEWEDITGFRNTATHEYFSVLREIVWNTAISEVPELHKQVIVIFQDEYKRE